MASDLFTGIFIEIRLHALIELNFQLASSDIYSEKIMNVLHLSLIYDETTGSLAEDTVKYGVFLVVASLVPAIIAVIHTSVSWEAGARETGSQLWAGAGILLSVLLFPFVPIYFYIKLLVTSNPAKEEDIRVQKVDIKIESNFLKFIIFSGMN